MSERAITLRADAELLAACQEAIAILMIPGGELDERARDKIAVLLGFISEAQQELFKILTPPAKAA